MKSYICRFKDDSGRIIYGFVQAVDKRQVKRKVKVPGLYFLGCSRASTKSVFRSRASLDALLMFTHRFSSLIESGIPILDTMNILWRQTEDRTFQLVISYLRQRLEDGHKVSEAMAEFPNIFPLMYISLLRVAEKSGGLVGILRKLLEYLQYHRQIIIKVQKATFYPAIVLIFAFFVLLIMFTFVVPTFQTILVRLKVELPHLTKIVLLISSVLKSPVFWSCAVVFVVVGYLIFRQLRKNLTWASWTDGVLLKIPYLGHVFYSIAISRFVRSLGIMMGAGLPVVESFEVAKSTSINKKVIAGLSRAQKRIEQGDSFYHALKEGKIFPLMLIEMIGSAEASGSMVKTLENLSSHFDEEVDFRLNKFLTLLEPLLIILVGGIVILTLLAIYLPIFTIWQTLSA